MSDIKMEANPQDLVRELEAVLGRRVEQLERENRQLKRTGTFMFVAVAAMFLLTAGMLFAMRAQDGRVADVLEAHRFVLRDSEGHMRGLMGFNADGAPRIILHDRDGRERLRLTLLGDGSPGLSLADREGRSRTVFGLLPDETSTLVFADRTGATRAVFGLGAEDSPTLVFTDRAGATRVGLSVDAEGDPSFTLYEQEQALPGEGTPAEQPIAPTEPGT